MRPLPRLALAGALILSLAGCRRDPVPVVHDSVSRTCPGADCSTPFHMAGHYTIGHSGDRGDRCDVWLDDSSGQHVAELYGYNNSVTVVGDGSYTPPQDGTYHLEVTDDSGQQPGDAVCKTMSVSLTSDS